jgi:hypothetical protein
MGERGRELVIISYFPAMSALDATINEIRSSSEGLDHDADGAHVTGWKKPDYLARQHALFGNHVLADSQVIMDELRAERF